MTQLNPHDALSLLGAQWLRRVKKCQVVLIDPKTTYVSEIPDVLGYLATGYSTLIEVKVSLQDFKADLDKPHRKHAKLGMGQERYYLTPKGLIDPKEIPKGWGLLEADSKDRISVKVPIPPTRFKQVKPETLAKEVPLLLLQIKKMASGAPHHLYQENPDDELRKVLYKYLKGVALGWKPAWASVQALKESSTFTDTPLTDAVLSTFSEMDGGKMSPREGKDKIRSLLAKPLDPRIHLAALLKIGLNYLQWAGKTGKGHMAALNRLYRLTPSPERDAMIKELSKAKKKPGETLLALDQIVKDLSKRLKDFSGSR